MEEGEYLSDLSSDDDEELELLKKIKAKQSNNSKNDNKKSQNTNNNYNNNNNYNRNNNDNNNNNNNYNRNNNNNNNNNNNYDSYYNYNQNGYIDHQNDLFGGYMPISREIERLQIEEAIRVSLIETTINSSSKPRYQNLDDDNDNYNTNNYYRPPFHGKHYNQTLRNQNNQNIRPNPNQNENQEISIEEIIRQSEKEEADTKVIRDFVSNKENLRLVLTELPGVNPNDPCFTQFYL